MQGPPPSMLSNSPRNPCSPPKTSVRIYRPPAVRQSVSSYSSFNVSHSIFSPCSGTVKMSAPAFLYYATFLIKPQGFRLNLTKRFFGYNHVVFLYE